MEAVIILDGFKNSEKVHNLRFKRIIGDGDSSVLKKNRAARTYGPNYFIEN